MSLVFWQEEQVIIRFRKKGFIGSCCYNHKVGFIKMSSMRALIFPGGRFILYFQQMVVVRLGGNLKGEEETSGREDMKNREGIRGVFIAPFNGLEVHQKSLLFSRSYNLFSKSLSNMNPKGKQIVEYPSPEKNLDYSSSNIIPISEIENLSASFKRKINIPIKSVPFVNTPEMELIEEENNKFSVVIRCIDVTLAGSTIRNQIRKTWPDFEFKDPFGLTEEIFQVNLTKVEDFRKAIMEQPWILHNHIIQVVPWKVYHRQGEEVFKNFYVWFQIPAMPEIYIKEKALEDILRNSELFLPNQLQKIEIINEEQEGEKYARIKTILDVNEPLPPGIRVPLNGMKVIVPFVYEFIHMLCYRCGRIGHHQYNCDVPEKDAGNLFSPKNRMFSSSPPPKKFETGIKNRFGNVRRELGQIKQNMLEDLDYFQTMKKESEEDLMPKNAKLFEVKIEEFKGKGASPSTFNPLQQSLRNHANPWTVNKKGFEDNQGNRQLTIPGIGKSSDSKAGQEIEPIPIAISYEEGSGKEWGRKFQEGADMGKANWNPNFNFKASKKSEEDPEYKPKQCWVPKRTGHSIGERVSSRIWRDRSCTKQKKRQAELCAGTSNQGVSKKACMQEIIIEDVSSSNVGQEGIDGKGSGIGSSTLVSSALDLLQQYYNDPLIREVVDAEARRTGRKQSPPPS